MTTKDHKRVWGHGYNAGLKAAGGSMQQAKLDRTLDGITAVARKVYDCVPKQEWWSRKEIVSEVRRKQLGIEVRAVDGCLHSLIDSNLVKESKGTFQAVTANPPSKPHLVKTVVDKGEVREKTPVSDKVAAICEKIREASEMLSEVADDVELILMEVEDEAKENDAKLKKLEKMGELFRGLME